MHPSPHFRPGSDHVTEHLTVTLGKKEVAAAMSDGLIIATGPEVAASPPYGAERRASRRHVTSMPATIILENYDRVPCVLRDLSEGGAKIGLARRYALSTRFWIVIRHADIARRASLVWRNGEFAGIAFDQPFR